MEHVPAIVVDDTTADDVARAIIASEQQHEPFYVFDMNKAYHYIQKFKQSMPRVQPFYAMKANNSEMMLRLAVAMGLGFDCASPGEINRILNYNVQPTSIIYAFPTKTPDQIMYARSSGVRHTTFQTSCELKKIKQFWPDARLLIRIKVDSDSIYKLAEKFGCDFETEAVNLLEEAARLDLTVIGVAFHVGSVCFSIDSYVVALRNAKKLFDHEASANRQMKILDIGGGFFCEDMEKFDQVSQLINETLDELFPDHSVQVIAEPGRFLSECALNYYCNINNVRQLIRNDKPINILYLNDGIHGTFRYMERWHQIHKFQNFIEDNNVLEDTILVGPTTDSKDVMEVVQLPRCVPNDWLKFTYQGAYTFTFSGNYAGFSVPKIRPIISSRVWNEIKDNSVFSASDFVLNATIGEPLPTSLPLCLPDIKHEHLDYSL